MVSKRVNRDKALQSGICSNQDGDETSNQFVSHQTNTISVKANDSLPKVKEIEMIQNELQILMKTQLDLLNSDLSCSICGEIFVKPVNLPCKQLCMYYRLI